MDAPPPDIPAEPSLWQVALSVFASVVIGFVFYGDRKRAADERRLRGDLQERRAAAERESPAVERPGR